MFSHLSARRFPRERIEHKAGPGSYEVPSFIDESSRFEANSSICDVSTFSVFVDDLDSEQTIRTPRGGDRQPFGRTTKENIVTTPRRVAKSNGPASKPDDLEATHGIAIGHVSRCTTPRRTATANERNLVELQKRVEELEKIGRDSEKTIAGQVRHLTRLEAEKAQWKKSVPESEDEPLMERLHRVEDERDRLRDQLENISGPERILEAAATPVEEPVALMKLVAELVDRELSMPRNTLCLQRKAWERQTELLRKQTEKLECKLEKNCKEQDRCKQEALAGVAIAQARAAAAEELAEQRQWALELLQKKIQVMERCQANHMQVVTPSRELEAEPLSPGTLLLVLQSARDSDEAAVAAETQAAVAAETQETNDLNAL